MSRPTTAGVDGEVRTFTHMAGWAVRVGFAACDLSPDSLCHPEIGLQF